MDSPTSTTHPSLSRRLLVVAMLCLAGAATHPGPALAEPPPDAAAWLFDPSAVSQIELAMPQSSINALKADPDTYVDATFTLTSAGGTIYGPLAVGLTGEDAHTITATKHQPEIDGELVDIGRVGEITAIDTGAIEALLADGRIPVVSSIARSQDDHHVYNVNADTAAAALAAALGAETLMVLTDVEGLYEDWPNSDEVISRLTASQLEKLLPELSSGMVPKMEGCLHAVRNGVNTARVIDGRVQHSILLEIFTDEGIGTMVVPDEQEGDAG